MQTLFDVLADWTQFKIELFQSKAFEINSFMQSFTKTVFGQDMALNVLFDHLENILVTRSTQPIACHALLFAGPPYTGKKTTASALVKYLFKHPDHLYFCIQDQADVQHLPELVIQSHANNKLHFLSNIIHHTPNLVLVIEDIENMHASLLSDLCKVLVTGQLLMRDQPIIHFAQVMIIMTTTIGSHALEKFKHAEFAKEEVNHTDLMELFMNDAHEKISPGANIHCTQDMMDELHAAIRSSLPRSITQQAPIIPFFPLSTAAMETIVHAKLEACVTELNLKHAIELTYAPEVISYLVNEVFIQEDESQLNPDHAYELVNKVINHALSTSNHTPSQQLFLQLNETGQRLHGEWMQPIAKLG